MQRYILRRLLLGALTGLLVSLLIFSILRIAPGDVAMMIALDMTGDEDLVTEAQLERIRDDLGLDAPLPVQYWEWVSSWVTGDWGRSMFSEENIWGNFKAKMPVTLQLVIMTVTLATIVGIPIGIIMALKQDTWVDYVLRIFSLGGLSMPAFWTATLLLAVGMYVFSWSPEIGYIPIFEDPIGNMKQFIWPAMVLGYVGTATRSRMMRSSLLEVLRQDYIRTAHAKGLRGFVVTYRHAMKNALLPVITIIGVSIAVTMGGSVIIERIFVLDGIGNMLVQGMNQRDFPVVQSLVLMFSLWVVGVNLLVDLSYGMLDPRVRFD